MDIQHIHAGLQYQHKRVTVISQTCDTSSNQIKIIGLGSNTNSINDQEFRHVTERFESIRMFLSKQTGWPEFVQLQSDSNNNCHKIKLVICANPTP